MSTSLRWIGNIFLSFFKRSAHFLYKKYLAPLSQDEDNRRREFILNILLVSSICMLALLDASVLYHVLLLGPDYHGISFPAFSLILGCFIFLLFLSRSGKFVAVSYIFIALYFISISYAAYQWGADLPSVILGYALLIVISSILVSTRFSFLVTLLIGAFTLPLWNMQVLGLLKPDWYWKGDPRLTDGVVFFIIFAVIAVVSWLSNKEIENSLRRARESEAALREERNLLEVKIEERTRELRQAQLERMSQLAKFAEIGRLATGMIHDLLNPLTAVALNIEELERHTNESGTARHNLDSAIQATRRMENMISAIRKRMSQQEVQVTFALNAEIEQVFQLFDYQAKKNGVQLSFEKEEEVQIFGDPIKFHQVVANLVSNAIDSYDHSGLAKEGRREVQVTLLKRRDIIRLIVQDWGVGIPQEYLAKIFDPFFTTKEMSKGTGLGLATVKNLVEKVFGGRLEIQSAVGKGTTVLVEFAA